MNEPYHILLVEDNPGDVRLVQECLHEKDIPFRMTQCETAESAIRMVMKYTKEDADLPDLILLDYNLPGGDARAVIVAAAANPALAATRKAVITSSVSPRDKQDALQSGADCFIYKPCDLDAFLVEVGQALETLLSSSRQRI